MKATKFYSFIGINVIWEKKHFLPESWFVLTSGFWNNICFICSQLCFGCPETFLQIIFDQQKLPVVGQDT